MVEILDISDKEGEERIDGSEVEFFTQDAALALTYLIVHGNQNETPRQRYKRHQDRMNEEQNRLIGDVTMGDNIDIENVYRKITASVSTMKPADSNSNRRVSLSPCTDRRYNTYRT